VATLDQLNKPRILTESDRILTDLSKELENLKDRMGQLEKEQEDSRQFIDQVSFQEQLASKLVNFQQREIDAQKENYQVIAGVMHNLKSPVSSVMENLASIIREIDDPETQDSLKDCINTASSVLEGFTEVEEFCLFESGSFQANPKTLNLRTFFTDLVSKFQLDPALGRKHSLKLLVDAKIPGQNPVYAETLSFAVQGLLEELAILAEPGVLELKVRMEEGPKQPGVELLDLVVEISMAQATELALKGSWVEFVKAHAVSLRQQGFSLLKTRDRVRQTGGLLEMMEQKEQLKGFRFSLPMTY